VGDRSIRNDKNGRRYVFVKRTHGKWVEEQKLNWQAKHGKIPEGMILACKTADTLNTHPDNWELISRANFICKKCEKDVTLEILFLYKALTE
jgi:hypothetical protein